MSVIDARKAAREARQEVSASEREPIDVLRTAERLGMQVVLASALNGPAGLFTTTNGMPYAYVNTRGVWAPRQRFTLAHELGHFRLGHQPSVDQTLDMASRNPLERDANEFAAELLVPAAMINAAVEERTGHVDLDLVVSLAEQHGVSASVVLFRIDNLRGLPAPRKRAMLAALEEGEHRHLRGKYADRALRDAISYREAGNIATRVPGELRALVLHAWQSSSLDDLRAASLLRMTPTAFRRMVKQDGLERIEVEADAW